MNQASKVGASHRPHESLYEVTTPAGHVISWNKRPSKQKLALTAAAYDQLMLDKKSEQGGTVNDPH